MKRILYGTILMFQSLIVYSQNEGDQLFDNSIIHNLEIISNFPGNLIDSLDVRHQNESTLGIDWSYLQVAAYFDGDFVDSIGVRIKGGDVSYSTTKPSLKLDLNEFVQGRKYDGLKKINVDNCLHDPSFMREKLYYDIANGIGLKSSRTSFVKVVIDGVSYGNYVYIEQINKQFLENNFGNKNGNLFKARGGGNLNIYGNNTQLDYPYQYDLKTNEEVNDWSDLLLLIDKTNNTPSVDYKDTISKYLNVDAVLNYMALGTYIVYGDNIFNGGNNGYWYHNTSTDKFEIIPWDIDISFFSSTIQGYEYSASNTELINPILNHSIFEKLLNIPEFKTSYLEKCCFIHNHLGHEDSLKNQIDEYKTLMQSASITPDDNCDYTSFSDPNNPFIADYTFLGLKDFAEMRHGKMSSEFIVSNFICSNISGTNDFNREKFDIGISPNPAIDHIKIFFKNGNPNITKMSITNTVGQIVMDVENKDFTHINIKDLISGLYFISIYGENGEETSIKFIKE